MRIYHFREQMYANAWFFRIDDVGAWFVNENFKAAAPAPPKARVLTPYKSPPPAPTAEAARGGLGLRV
jgi:hypothetical protein